MNSKKKINNSNNNNNSAKLVKNSLSTQRWQSKKPKSLLENRQEAKNNSSVKECFHFKAIFINAGFPRLSEHMCIKINPSNKLTTNTNV